MREQVETRIENLRAEYRAGQEMLVDLEERRANLQVTLARISGAIQVLGELLQGSHSDAETTSIGGERGVHNNNIGAVPGDQQGSEKLRLQPAQTYSDEGRAKIDERRPI